MKNEGIVERSIQVTISVAFLLGAIFWSAGIWQIVFFLAALLVGTFAIIGFCPLYAIIGKGGSCSTEKLTKGKIAFLVLYASALLAGGSYVSLMMIINK